LKREAREKAGRGPIPPRPVPLKREARENMAPPFLVGVIAVSLVALVPSHSGATLFFAVRLSVPPDPPGLTAPTRRRRLL
jgi:hypothetical protein